MPLPLLLINIILSGYIDTVKQNDESVAPTHPAIEKMY